MPSTAPLIDAQEILRVVGGPAMQRGTAYRRDGAVLDVSWDDAELRLRGRVRGSEQAPYQTQLVLTAASGKPQIRASSCSCPIGAACKHVAATALQSNTTRLQAEHAQTRPTRDPEPADDPTDWRSRLTSLLEANDDDAETATTPLALQFELRELGDTFSKWAAKRGIKRRSANHKLGVRPVVRNERGKWVRGSLAWSNISFQTQGLSFDPEQHRWFSQFPGLHRATGVGYFGQNDSWLYLDDFTNPLLWQLLDEARRLGIEFVTTKKGSSVEIGHRADIGLDVRTGPDAPEGPEGEPETPALHIVPQLTVDGVVSSVTGVSPIGDHGIYRAIERDDGATIQLAPLASRLTPAQKELLTSAGETVIPSEDTRAFIDEVYPALVEQLPIRNSSRSVRLPQPLPPRLVLEISHLPGPAVALSWHWLYQLGERKRTVPLGASGKAGRRDRGAEDAVLETVAPVLDVPASEIADATLHDVDAAEFVEHVMPRLIEMDEVDVENLGTVPDFRELTETPELVVSTVDSEQRDWFDLGLEVRIAGHKIPFRHIFEALSGGKSKVLLVDGSYFSINRPEFQRLTALIEDSRELREWETGPRISRYQAGLWEELEELAYETNEAATWKQTVSGLLEVSSVEPPPLPDALDADLRPYQVDGFAWLVFLYEHGLGGVLADDMGLGKTLQTLALIAHARANADSEQDAGTDVEPAPFLVVAPTSVVHNWVYEAARFTPSLTVRAVTRTEGKSPGTLTAAYSGADVVVTSYALLRLDENAYGQRDWAGLILDEAQFVKNRTAKVHRVARDIAAPFKLAITGTPMENNLMELWAMFAITAPGLFPNARQFTEDFVTPIEREHDPRMLERLRRRVRPLMMRRTKEMVAKDLPEKQEQILEVELNPAHRKLYETQLQRERQKILGLLEDLDKQRFIVFRSLTLLRMLALDPALIDEEHDDIGSAKLDAMFEKLDSVLAEGHRALVFSQFTSFLKRAAARLDEAKVPYAYLDGSTTQRGDVISSFKDGDAGVFLISLKAGGFGLNLTEADYVFLLDPWWNPAAEEQAIDRTHRIGQTRNVMVYRLVSHDTIEEKVMALKDQKAALFASVMDDDAAFSEAITAEDIRSLLE